MPHKPFAFEPFTLIGEEIAGAWNAQALSDTARAWGGDYLAYDAADSPSADAAGGIVEPCPQPAQEEHAKAIASPLDAFDWLLAAENTSNAQSIYDCRPPVLNSQKTCITTGRPRPSGLPKPRGKWDARMATASICARESNAIKKRLRHCLRATA